MKRVIKRLLAWTGYSIHSRPRVLLRSPDRVLRLDLSFVVSHLLARRPDPFLLQVGAYDGLANDPWCDYIRRYNLAGLLIEPQPGPFARLVTRYADRPKVQVSQVAVSDTDGTRELFHIRPAAGDPVWTEQIASFRKEIILSHAHVVPGLTERVESANVPCRTFNSLFHEYSVDQVDILQVDTEGFDYEVLKLFPFDRYRPLLVRYEHSHLSASDQNNCLQMLADLGYHLHVPDLSSMDTLGYLLDSDRPPARLEGKP